MRYILCLVALLSIGCTHRLALVYESADAVDGDVNIIKSAGDVEFESKQPAREQYRPEEKEDEESSSNIFDNLLP